MIRFLAPTALILLPFALAWTFWHWRKIRGLSRQRRILVISLRSLIVLSLCLAISFVEWKLPSRGNAVVFVLDQSDSVSFEARKAHLEFINKAIRELGPDDQAGIISFGKEAVIEAPFASKLIFGEPTSKVDRTASNLASAMRLAMASFPAGKSRRMVVLSDGLQTSGDAASVGYELAEEGVPVDYFFQGDSGTTPEVSLVGMQTPSEVVKNQTFNLKIQINSRLAGKGTLIVERNGQIVSNQKVSYPAGITSLLVPQTLQSEGMNRYQAMLNPDGDQDKRNNLAAGFVRVQGQTRVLILQQNPSDKSLINALTTQGILADLRGPDRIPSKAEELQNFDLIILNDINATGFLPNQMKLIESSVNDTGIGLMMIGGEHSYLPGGWYATPVAKVLPVDLNIRQRRVTTGASILVIADMSGSMGIQEDGIPKFKLAAEAARRTVDLMTNIDRIGVAGSDSDINYIAPLQNLTDKQKIKSEIDTLQLGGGGIYMLPSLEFAAEKLRAETSKVRHLIILADGSDADSQAGCNELAKKLRKEKITMSVVSIGFGPHTPFLRGLAAVGGGRFYLADRASKLPAIFTQDTAIASRSAIEEGKFQPRATLNEESLQGIGEVPPIYGYCIAEPQPWARVGMRSPKDDVLLARGQSGLGATFAYMSDAAPRWSRDWTSWSGFSKFWAQSVRSVTRRATNNDVELNTIVENGKGVVEITTTQIGTSKPPPNIRLLRPDGTSETLSVRSVGPGEYRSDFDANEYGSYIASASGESTGVDGISGFSVSYPPEYSQVRADEALLKEIAEISKGRKVSSPSEVFTGGAKATTSFQPLSFYLVIFALLLLPFDIAARRITVSAKEIFQWITGKQRADSPSQRLGALKAIKQTKNAETTVAAEEFRKRMATISAEKLATSLKPTQDQAKDSKPSGTLGEFIKDSSSESKPANSLNTGQSLLDSKRRRQEERDRENNS